MTTILIKAEYEGQKLIADDYTLIKKGQCRLCKQKVEPYSEAYVGKVFYGVLIAYKYDMASGYCRECAKLKADEVNRERSTDTPYEVDTIRGCHGKETHYMSNGLVIEDLTPYDREYQERHFDE